MDVQPDFKELLALLNFHKVKYLVVGGYALAFHGAPRTTGDIDIYVQPTIKNAKKVLAALQDFGFISLGLSQEDFSREDQIVQLGHAPVRIDIITSLSGVAWGQSYQHREKSFYGNVPIFYLGRTEFIKNKKAIGRKKDIADIESIGP